MKATGPSSNADALRGQGRRRPGYKVAANLDTVPPTRAGGRNLRPPELEEVGAPLSTPCWPVPVLMAPVR